MGVMHAGRSLALARCTGSRCMRIAHAPASASTRHGAEVASTARRDSAWVPQRGAQNAHRARRIAPRSTQGTVIDMGEEGEAESDEFFDTYLASNVLEVTGTPQLLGELTRAKDRLVIVYFYSASCHACALVRPLLGRLAQETWEDVVYLKVSMDANPTLCANLGIEQLPYLNLYKGARGRIAGFPVTRATFQRLRGTVDRERAPMCSRGRRRVSTRLLGAPPQLTTKEKMKMKLMLKQAMDGECLAMPSLQATRWVHALDAAHLQRSKPHSHDERSAV